MVDTILISDWLTDWSPWWLVKSKIKKIQELGEPEDLSHLEHCPVVASNIPSFSSICIKSSPCIKFGLLNVLYGYCYAVRYCHGDYSDTVLEMVNIVQMLR